MIPTIVVIDPEIDHRDHFQGVLKQIGAAGVFFDNPDQLPPEFDIAAYPAAVVDLDHTKRPKPLLENWRRRHKTIRLIGLSRETFHPELGDIIDRYLFACVKKPVESEELALLLKNIVHPEGLQGPGETLDE